MNLPTQVSDITDRSRGWWDEAPPMQRYVAIGIASLLVLGLDLDQLCTCVENRLQRLQQGQDPDECTVPGLIYDSSVSE